MVHPLYPFYFQTTKMKSGLFLFFLSLVFSKAVCQVRTDSVLIEGNYRAFHFHQPKGASPKRNVIFVLHGSGGNGKGMMKPAANLEALAEKEQFLLVYPDGYKKGVIHVFVSAIFLFLMWRMSRGHFPLILHTRRLSRLLAPSSLHRCPDSFMRC